MFITLIILLGIQGRGKPPVFSFMEAASVSSHERGGKEEGVGSKIMEIAHTL